MIDDFERQNNIRESIESTRTYDRWIARESIAYSVASIHLINKINENIRSLIARESSNLFLKSLWISWVKIICVIKFNSFWTQINLMSLLQRHDQNRSLWWASQQLNSESASMTFFVNSMIYLLTSLYLSVNRSILCFCATSESASMTSFVNAMIYLLTSLYLSVNLIIHLRATSESASTISSSMQWSTHLHRSIYQWIVINCISHATSESATMIITLLSYSESVTIDISIVWKIDRKINRKTSIETLRQCYELHYKS
jgi:hypothetical protein